ncbi:STAS domain-containing protein [Streptomyces sp. WAC00263]|uniref:STAS domain-containing protein n=1 Tax=Streptomyces sp. WAC00263 TaxID=1917422 RepID=UPI0015EFC5F8|nr:STAS domain-containing protein [Streptomyces sp. WAC00263]KAF5999210.1 sulfate transporter [Streptomyces sp. WAC00263]
MYETRTRSAPCLRECVVGPVTVVVLHGEIDILTAPPITARLDALLAGPSPELVLDLRSVAFIDCSGLAVLCRARNRVRAQGGRLCLVISSPRILWMLRRTGLAHAFDVYSCLPEALSRTSATATGPPCPQRPADRRAEAEDGHGVTDQFRIAGPCTGSP